MWYIKPLDIQELPSDRIHLETIMMEIYKQHFNNPKMYTLDQDADERLAQFSDEIETAKESVGYNNQLHF